MLHDENVLSRKLTSVLSPTSLSSEETEVEEEVKREASEAHDGINYKASGDMKNTSESRERSRSRPELGVTAPMMSAMIQSYVNNSSATSKLKDFIFTNLRFRSLAKFSQPLLKSRFFNSGVEGFQSSDICVSTSCDLHTFLELVSTLRFPSLDSTTSHVRLSPSPQAFEVPSRATSSLSIDFGHINQFLGWLLINDNFDRQAIKVKSARRMKNSMLRILGTSCVVNVQKHNGDHVEVDCILPFMSCTASQIAQLSHVLNDENKGTSTASILPNSTEIAAHRVDTVLFRYRENYDDAQGRFLSPWRSKTIIWNVFPHSTSTVSSKKSDPALQYVKQGSFKEEGDSCFSIEWRIIKSLPSSMWTSDAKFSGLYVLGEIYSFFPTVTFFGSSTSTEILNLLSEVS